LKRFKFIFLIFSVATYILTCSCSLSLSGPKGDFTRTVSPEVNSSTQIRGSIDQTPPLTLIATENVDTTLTKVLIPPSPTFTRTVTPIKPTSASSQTPPPSETPTPTVTPTYAILRGQVIPERANCRYGPGASYLYKYGLVGGSNLEIIGRNELGTWVLIQAIGGDNPCWVKADLMEIRGEVLAVQPVSPDKIQAWSPYYPPLTGVSAVREGVKVTVFWHPLVLRAGDDSEQVPYVVEVWICQDGQIGFMPFGSFGTSIEITDEPGCSDASHGRVLAAEKHGYTRPVEIQWPPAVP
jgi:hypothetical protein